MATSETPKIDHGRSRPRQHAAATESVAISSMNISSNPNEARSQAPAPIARGRAHRFKGRSQVLSEPHITVTIGTDDASWKVSELTAARFNTHIRPSKPQELGQVGTRMNFESNLYAVLKFPVEGLVYQYYFHMETRQKIDVPRDRRRILYESWLSRYLAKHEQVKREIIAFDNQNTMITFGEPLPAIDEFGIKESIKAPNRAGRFQEYQITVKRVGDVIDLKTLAMLEEVHQPRHDNNLAPVQLHSIKQVLSIATHERCSSDAHFIYNRTFFREPVVHDRHGHWDLSLGKALWRGFYSCLVFSKGTHQLLMNLDISHAVFQKRQPFLEFLCELLRYSPCGQWYNKHSSHTHAVTMSSAVQYLDSNENAEYYDGEIEYLLQYCKHLSVRSNSANRKIGYTIHGFGKSASTQTFVWEQKNNESITVENYFKERYGTKLEYPSLPTVEMQKKSYVPMELLETIPVRIRKITDEQRAMLCLKSSMLPRDYSNSINTIRRTSEQQEFEQDPFIKAWRLKIDTRMLTAPARVLPGPIISYIRDADRSYVHGSSTSVWNNTQDEFCEPMNFPDVWGIINLSILNEATCVQFYEELRNVANHRGMKCCNPTIYEEYNIMQYSISNMISSVHSLMTKKNQCKFFIVLLPADGKIRDRVYGELKKLCELEYGLGIVTQMIKTDEKSYALLRKYSKLNSILLKINTKLKGVNSILQVPKQIEEFFSRGHRIMYVGIDLSHGAPSSSRGRSTVAVVASADDIPNRYFKEIYMQERPSDAKGESWEYVVDMKDIMKSLINQYYEKHQGQPPTAIVIYRDGISESEFDTVFEKELTAIREACVELSPVYHPHLTYIVVNKRHHTRFFVPNSKDNVPAGTVVDSHDVTHATTYDFFLTSHQAQKGTSRPTHYHVLYDDNKLTPDQVQLLTYNLCYASARCTRSISIPAPVKYADLLAFRATFYVDINEPRNTDQPAIPINQSTEVSSKILSKRIVLNTKLDTDCVYFI
ncbi:unnamed protein product [Adineta ricciae]|uniref:Uncharacterized protein n=1 Tax=Adineta ricciae TaxID=249248 RepID=A0A813RZS8_ADIRI|nr:unnamed protein product [Adineta ricciae]CAF1095360.1 unnamed protein product [Adineta ricciae]